MVKEKKTSNLVMEEYIIDFLRKENYIYDPTIEDDNLLTIYKLYHEGIFDENLLHDSKIYHYTGYIIGLKKIIRKQ